MTCPKCGGKVVVTNNSHNTDDNEIYRERACNDCYHIFYTAEIVVENDEQFKDNWYKYHRDRGRFKTHVGRYKKEKENDT